MAQISIFEDGKTIAIEISPEHVRYEFDSWGEAFEALPNLPEAANKDGE